MIDAYLQKNTLSIVLENRWGQDERYHMKHPERIITKENFAEVAKELYPYFLLGQTKKTMEIWDRYEIIDAIACALYLHFIRCLHQADKDNREELMQ